MSAPFALRRRAVAALGALLMLLTAGAVLTASPAAAGEVEDFLRLTNEQRTARGLAPLRPMAELNAVAQAQSQRMASSSTLFHNPNLASEVTNWRSLAENVGYAGDIPTVVDAFMNSAPHRANLLGAFQELGVGVVRSGSRVWVTQVFRTPVTVAAATPTCPLPDPAAGALAVQVRRAGYWYLRDSLSSGPAEGCFPFGDAGDVPVTGDWDGNGSKTPGVFRPSTGTWYLSNDAAGRAVDAVLRFASPGDVPVAGDWDGDGRDSVGAFRPGNGTWYLRNALSSGGADRAVRYGSPGDQPVAGDWDRDGVDSLGVFRAATGTWYLANGLSGRADGAFRYGSPGDRAVVGDWNADRTDTLGVYRGGTLLMTNRFDSGAAEGSMQFGSPGDVPVVGRG